LRHGILLADLRAISFIERPSTRPPDDDVLREDHRAPDDLSFPGAILLLERTQMRERAIGWRQYSPGTIRH
jgi:hypothetical protein